MTAEFTDADYNALTGTMGRVKHLEQDGNVDSALDVLYDNIDTMLKLGLYSEVDDFMLFATVNGVGVDILLGLLTITHPAKARFKYRHKFFIDVVTKLLHDDTLETVTKLLSGLE